MRLKVVTGFIVCLLLGLFIFSRLSKTEGSNDAAFDPTEMRTTDKNAAKTDASNGENAAAAPAVNKHEPQTAEEKELAAWLSVEATRLDRMKIKDEKSLQQMLDLQAKSLTAGQTRWLGKQAVNAQTPINERMLSVHLAGLAQSEFAFEALRDIATAPLTGDGQFDPHSESEVTHMQDKTIRIAALEQMADRVREDRTQLGQFQKTVAAIADKRVQQHGLRLLKELERN